ncbi:MAG TPA: S-layer homology domain-containing protein [Chloroflexia bacterium]|nr:S-layer homology domain-containing protein [Chloroflexia bacterium]
MTKRLFGSLIIAGALALLLLGASVLFFSGSTQAQGQPAVAGNIAAAQGSDKGYSQPQAPNGVWATVAPLPTISIPPTPGTYPLKLKRGGAAAYPPNGKVYVMGGRHGVDGEDTTLTNIYEYTPGTPGSWLLKTAQVDPGSVGSRFTANMSVSVLTDTNGVRIYAIGGSSTDSIPTNMVRVYNPVADTISTLATDPWPATPARIPGGWAVLDNKLYIFGGFSALGSGSVFTDTWKFDPMAAPGARWTQLPTANLNLGRGYIAGAALDGYIYAIGGDTWTPGSPGTLVPVANVERMDPSQLVPTWTNLASLPTARGDMGAWAYDTGSPYEIAGQVAVAGGHYLTPDNQGYIYNPSANSWTAFPNMINATRNYGYAQLNGFLYAIGGYNFSMGLPDGANFVQRYDATGPGPSPTPTNTGTPPTATRTTTSTTVASTSTGTVQPTNTVPVTNTVPPTNTVAATTATATACSANYTYTSTTGGVIVPGTVDIGNHGDDVITSVTLPFSYTVYDQSFTTVNVSSNGNLQFNSAITGLNDYINACLPVTDRAYSYTIYAFWDDQITAPAGKGVFSSVTGVTPNRIFNLEFRTCGFSTATTCAAGTDTNYEIRLYEGQRKFDLIYAVMGLSGSSATVGIQKDTTTFSQSSCNTAIAVGTMITGTAGSCGTTTPVPSGTTAPSSTAAPPTSTAPPSATSVPPSATTIPASATAAATATCVPASGTQDVSITSFAYTPQELMVAAGTTVMWTNMDGSHSTTSDTAIWDSGVLTVGGQFSHTFNTPGTYTYHCSVHPSAMTGTIIVGASCATSTVVPSATPDPTATTEATAVPTSTVCTIVFSDVSPVDEFYPYIMCLACQGIVSGYDDGTFRPFNDIIRGQIAKVVSNSAGYSDPIPGGTQTFTDVPSSNPFYIWIERVHLHGSITGYPCGGPFEPCDGDNRPYFRPYSNATRGQLSKIVAISANISDPVPSGQQTYTDVPPDSTFWLYIEQLTALGVMGGYPCGGPGEPCDSENRPYFRPNNNVTRAQASKIDANTFFPECAPGSR